MRIKQIILLFFTSVYGCGYIMSGSWDDEPKNWKRAFGESVPKEVEIIHSRYSRYPHFTYEYEAYFMFNAEDKFVKSYFIDRFYLELVESDTYDKIILFDNKPEWFVNKKNVDYEIWVNIDSNICLYIDKESKTKFFNVFQL